MNTNMDKKTIKIVNPVQAGKYVENGLNPLKIYWSFDRWVWEFDRSKTKPLFDKWCKREL